jgi:hypothetical protein
VPNPNSRIIPIGGIKSPFSFISDILLILIIIFYIFSIGSFIGPDVYQLEYRTTYKSQFEGFVINEGIDQMALIAISSLWFVLFSLTRKSYLFVVVYLATVIIGILTFNKDPTLLGALCSLPMIAISIVVWTRQHNRNHHYSQLSVTIENPVFYLSVSAIIFASVSVGISLLGILYSDPLHTYLRFDYGQHIFVLLSVLSPILVALLVFCMPIRIILSSITVVRDYLNANLSWNVKTQNISGKIKFPILAIIVVGSVIFITIPYFVSYREGNNYSAVDDYLYYSKYIDQLSSTKSPADFITSLFTIANGDRPFSLLILYSLSIFVPIENSFEILTVIISPLYIVTIFFFVTKVTNNDYAALLASLLTICSFQLLSGIYAGFYANLIALTPGFISFIILVNILSRPSITNISLYLVVMVILLFCHVYTWSIIVLVTIIFLLLDLVKHFHLRKHVYVALLIIFTSAVIDIARFSVTGTTGLEQDFETVQTIIGFENYPNRWVELSRVSYVHLGGLLGNFAILALAVYFAVTINVDKNPFLYIILIFFSIGLFGLFLGNYIMLSRLAFNMPIQIAAALTILNIKNYTKGYALSIAMIILLVTISVRQYLNLAVG